jgi:feruloyl esterase
MKKPSIARLRSHVCRFLQCGTCDVRRETVFSGKEIDMLRNWVWFFLIVAISMILSVPPVAAASCESVASLALPDGTITSATLVAAGAFTPPGGSMMGGPGGPAVFKTAPAFCRVTATLTPTPDSDIKIEVWMPAENWNGKLVGIGNGVWAGSISYSALAEPLTKGYAAVATDTGHVGSGMDAKFAVGHKEKLIDFAYRAVHEMTVKAKTILAAFYGRKEQRSLWVSCSTGGRQGLMEAYRYPEDYDGISSMAPANPMVGLMISSLWTGYAVMKDDTRRLSRSQMTAVHKDYIDQCDEKDGLKDGIASDPERCNFNPAILQCKEEKREDCLTVPQVAALSDIYAGPKNPRTGKQIFTGFPPGSEQQLMMMAGGKEPFPVATSYFRDIVFNDPQWDYKSYDYDKDLAASYNAGSEILDVPSDGLGKFIEGGGKLLLSHGWADGLIPARNTVEFYKSMTANMNPEKAADSVRLFLIPGAGHCGGEAGVTDMLSVIDQWVETGKAPDRIIASSSANEKPLTRPLCPYPQVAKYKGSGSTDDAANFECKSE